MGRKTKHDYQEPGSFDRVLEAAIALADADADDDTSYHRAKARLLQAILWFRGCSRCAYRTHRPIRRRRAPVVPLRRRSET